MEEPVNESTEKKSRKVAKRSWKETWRDQLRGERPAVDVMSQLWVMLQEVNTPLGRLARRSMELVPPRASSSKPRGDDLLPLDVRAIDELYPGEPDLANTMKLMFTTLNYLWLGGKAATEFDAPDPSPLTRCQRFALMSFEERVRDLAKVEKLCPDFATSRTWLVEAKFDYAGEPIMSLEDLNAEQVVAVWPAIGEAAVQPVVDYLPEELREKVENPQQCLLPIHEWPLKPPRSRVRAAQDEWDRIVAAGYSRGLMQPVDPSEVFKDVNGCPVLNGAAAVKKMKKVGGEMKTMQRFISNFIPTNAYQQHIVGGDKFLPYLGQLTLLEQDEDEVWVCDSEDFTSCFNLFTLPAVWRPYMCFGKLVDARLMGGPPGKMVYPSMAVVPMGWINAVSICPKRCSDPGFPGDRNP